MDCVSPILDVASRLWDCTAKRAAYLTDLHETLESLRNAIEELKNVAEDVKTKVDRAEENREMRRTHEVAGWLDRVQVLEKEVMEILQKGDQEIQQKCLGTCCPKNCWSSYKIGKIASKKLGAVTELKGKGGFSDVVDRLPRAAVDERPMEKTVGLDRMYAEVCGCIQDEQLGIIGLYGMGGAGKTTLMTKVNNEFIRASEDFQIAIWVVVSRPASVGKVQEVIRNKLEIPDSRWGGRTEDERAVEIFNVLKAKRFVLLLDDVWAQLDLKKLGVPSPNSQNKSKVILTTRSLDVCRHMEAQKSIKVECLTEEEAIKLFKEKVGETTLNSHPDIPQFAKIAAKECRGLPLVLVTIGRAMAGKNTPQEWERAIRMLRTYPSNFSGMGDHVFPVLKFSYDNLPNDTIKVCFLYLAIVPEDHIISDIDLIFLWIGEGFFDESDNVDEALNQGHHIIDHLKTACLLEGVTSFDGSASVKMHDVIRDMALWLATEYSGNKNKILVEENKTVEAHQVSKWKEAQKISLWYTRSLEELTVPLYFPNLLTLIVRSEALETFPSGFFHFMPIIKVLDLSHTGITELPTGIGKLVALEYLDLSYTGLRELPVELKTLKRIRYLRLQGLEFLEIIYMEVISNLSMMRMFHLEFTRGGFIDRLLEKERARQVEYRSSMKDNQAIDLLRNNEALLEELEGLEHINWVSFPILSASSFQRLLSSQKLQNAMSDLVLERLEGMTLLELPRMKHLEFLDIFRCGELQEIKVDLEKEGGRGFVADYIPNSNFHSLRRVHVGYLPKLLDLTCLIYIPNLEDLRVFDCESMEEVIGDIATGISENLGIFSRLKYLFLRRLPNLKSISRRALPFPSLIELAVKRCPNLRKLPLDSNSARTSLKTIKGKPEWWEGLQWEDETMKHTFTPYYRRYLKEKIDIALRVQQQALLFINAAGMQ